MFVITFVMVQSYRSNSLDPISYSLSIISLNLVEAALKYFWLSIILSYAILIGIATCYAFTGQTDISKVKIRIIEILVFKLDIHFFKIKRYPSGRIANLIKVKRYKDKFNIFQRSIICIDNVKSLSFWSTNVFMLSVLYTHYLLSITIIYSYCNNNIICSPQNSILQNRF